MDAASLRRALLASAAMPFVFPARQVGGTWHRDAAVLESIAFSSLYDRFRRETIESLIELGDKDAAA